MPSLKSCRLCLPSLAAFLSLCLSPLQAAEVTPSAQVERFVSVRSAPVNGELLATLSVGASAELVATTENHYQVRLPDGTVGFVLKRFTTVRDAAVDVRPGGRLALHFMNVGQGDGTLLLCPDDTRILIDAGSSSGVSAQAVRDYLTEALGPDDYRIDTVIVTHADDEHFNLLPELLRGFALGQVYHVGNENDYNSPPFSDWLSRLPAERVQSLLGAGNRASPSPLMESLSCGGAELRILAAGLRDTRQWRDTRSIVLQLRYGDFTAILAADATTATEYAILSRHDAEQLRTDVLKVAHHGDSLRGNSDAWLSVVQPTAAIISAGGDRAGVSEELLVRFERFVARPMDNFHPLTVLRYRDGRMQPWVDTNYSGMVYSTADSGNIVVSSTGTGFTVETESTGAATHVDPADR